MPVVGNLLSSLTRIATALGTEESGLQGLIAEAIGRPLPPRIVDAPPCQDVAIDTPDLETELPIPRFFEREGGPYITAGAIVARDSATGRANLSIARLPPPAFICVWARTRWESLAPFPRLHDRRR
jgi:2,5-furandicarboxylate decarboxylase 1